MDAPIGGVWFWRGLRCGFGLAIDRFRNCELYGIDSRQLADRTGRGRFMKRLTVKAGASLVAIFSAMAAPAFAKDAAAPPPATDPNNTLTDAALPPLSLASPQTLQATPPTLEGAPLLAPSAGPSSAPQPAAQAALEPPAHSHHLDLLQLIDDVTIAPLAHLYGALPRPVRNGVHNILSNLNEPDVAINDLLQLHPGRAAKAVFRFAANTTIGVGGVFDVAKHAGAPHHDNDAATTLAYYRIGDGPSFHVPLIETDNAREAAGFAIDFVIDPVGWGQFKNADRVYASQMVMDAVDDRDQDAQPTQLASAQTPAPLADVAHSQAATPVASLAITPISFDMAPQAADTAATASAPATEAR
jgi:phospholipid-binding lipoprotein MlaA